MCRIFNKPVQAEFDSIQLRMRRGKGLIVRISRFKNWNLSTTLENEDELSLCTFLNFYSS